MHKLCYIGTKIFDRYSTRNKGTIFKDLDNREILELYEDCSIMSMMTHANRKMRRVQFFVADYLSKTEYLIIGEI